MRPPLAGRRAAARRLAAQVRERLEPVERVLPVKLPGFGGGERPQIDRPTVAASTPDDAAARIDAARERLRASIEPPDDPDASG